MRRIPQQTTLLSGLATSRSAGWRISDYKTIVLSIIGSSTANLKVFVKGGLGRGLEYNDSPNFKINPESRSSLSAWDFIDVVDLEDNASIDGDTGIALSGNVIRLVEVNTNALDWLAVEITALVAGTATVIAAGYTNQ